MSNTDEELKRMCESIADDLNEFSDGKLYDTMENRFVTEDEAFAQSDGDCIDYERFQTLGHYLFDDNYGIKVTHFLGENELLGVSICVACGGPNIYIDTNDSYVKGYWGGEVKVPFSYKISDDINGFLQEYMEEVY